MLRFYIHKVGIVPDLDLDEHAVPNIGDHNEVFSRETDDGLAAAAHLLSELGRLSEDEALVIRRDEIP